MAGEGLESRLWDAAELLRGRLPAGAARELVLGLVCLRALDGRADTPAAARWSGLSSQGPDLAGQLDGAVAAIEAHLPQLRGVLSRPLVPPGVDAGRLGGLVELMDQVPVDDVDELGRVYEYFLSRFAAADGRRSGEFYTPGCVVDLLVACVGPVDGVVYDPCCGTGGMFVGAARGGGALRCVGQESTPQTWRMARMNLALRGLVGDVGSEAADSLHADAHPGVRADRVLANPPFNQRSFGVDQLDPADPRWRWGVPRTTANFVWLQHILAHLAPDGRAAVVLAKGSLSSGAGGDAEIRRAMLESGVVAGVITLPSRLFYATQAPAVVWLLGGQRADREIVMIDASNMGTMVDRVHRVLDAGDVEQIGRWASACWTGATPDGGSAVCRVGLDVVRDAGWVLVPGRFLSGDVADAAPGEDAAALGAEVRAAMGEVRALDAALMPLLDALDGSIG